MLLRAKTWTWSARMLLLALLVGMLAGTATGSAAADGEAFQAAVTAAKANGKGLGQGSPEPRMQPQHVDALNDCREDPVGDVGDARADIIISCAYYDEREVVLMVGTRQATDPMSDPNWRGDTGAGWTIEGAGRTWFAAFFYDAGSTHFALFDGERVACVGVPGTGDGTFGGTLSPSCFSGAPSLTIAAGMIYDVSPNDPYGQVHVDVAPDSGTRTVTRHVHDTTATEQPRVVSDGSGYRSISRLAGASRIATAVAISQRAFPDGSSVVYLAKQDLNPDALVAGSLTDGPVLLVPNCGPLPGIVGDEIRRLGALEVIALGGESAVCQSLLDAASRA